jgi:hypothetical protein
VISGVCDRHHGLVGPLGALSSVRSGIGCAAGTGTEGVARTARTLKGVNMRKTIIAVALCAVSVVGVGAGSAFAGEVTGKGGPTGIENGHASPCAYSGLNDYVQGQQERRTQTPKDAAPGSPAFGWVEEGGFSCNKNGPVGG